MGDAQGVRELPPAWMACLTEEDGQFIRRFILASGSLKEIAQQYSVSYPTVRSRLDRLIAKIRVAESPVPKDPLERKLQLLVADGRLSTHLARELVDAYRKSAQKRSER